MRLILLPLLAPLTACATMAGVSPGPVALGQSQRVGGFAVTPIAVKEDSRCPMNARCIQAGRVVVRAAVTGDGERLERNFTLGEPVTIGRRAIVLDSVTPEQMAGADQPGPDYRVHFSPAG